MTRRKSHRTSVTKKNRGSGRLWWFECTCGGRQGWHEKADAQKSERLHLIVVQPEEQQQ